MKNSRFIHDALLPLLCSLTVQPLGAAPQPGQPNVLLMIADDLNDFVGPLRSYMPGLTPNIDRLAARGVSFNNAQANGLYCAPSRTSLLTGLYPTTTGYYGCRNDASGHMRNNAVIRDAVTMPESFLNHGYVTFTTGKLYHAPQHAEFQHFTGDAGDGDGRGIPQDFGPWPWDGKAVKGYAPPSANPALPAPFNSMPYDGYGRLSNLPDVPADPGSDVPGFKGWSINRRPWRYINDDDRDLMPDEKSVNWVSDIFRRDREKPFFLAVGFNRPHAPLYVPDKYFDMFPLDEIELPPMPADDLDDIPEEGRRLQDGTARLYRAFCESSGEQGLREFLQAYLASIRFVDDQVGALLSVLEDSPAGSNTLIVFTSDQGYHFGEKQRIGKNTCWERSARVPLIFAGAGVSGRGEQIDRPVSLVDLYPTLLELCGLPRHPNQNTDAPALDGHSLTPFLIAGRADQWAGPDVALSATDHARTVRSETYRYILHDGGGEELYDMRRDPNEFCNLSGNPEFSGVQRQLRSVLETLGERKHSVQ